MSNSVSVRKATVKPMALEIVSKKTPINQTVSTNTQTKLPEATISNFEFVQFRYCEIQWNLPGRPPL